jgi:hypothetical protein
MTETAKITSIGAQATTFQPEKPQDNGRSQLPGESVLWFKRYGIYRDLGHKRTLRAAVAKERESLRVVKEPVPATKSQSRQKNAKPTSLQTAEQVKPVEVPGSWKNASKTYRWKERAQSFDAWLMNQAVDSTIKGLGDTYANKHKRILLLETLITAIYKTLNDTLKDGTSHDTFLLYVKRIQSLLAQMQSEMKGFDDAAMRASIEAWQVTFLDEIEKAYQTGASRIGYRL